MNKLFTCVFLAVVVCLFSCQNAADKTTKTATKTVSLEDSLYKETMDIHNELMPKMGKLMGYAKLAQKQSDSIKSVLASTSFTTEVSQRIAKDVNTLDTLKANLQAADKAMNDWMEQFNPDPKMPTTEERAAYFADQKQKALVMREGFMKAYQQAEALFDKKK